MRSGCKTVSNCSGRGMVRKRMYDRGHGMVRWVSWILQLVTEICFAFAMHLLRMCSTSPRQVHLIYCREREAVMFGLWYERVWDGLMRCTAAAVLVARQNLVVCSMGKRGCKAYQSV